MNYLTSFSSRNVTLSIIVLAFVVFGFSFGNKTISANTFVNLQQENNLTNQTSTQVIGQPARNGLLEMFSQGDFVGAGKTYYLAEGVFTAQLGVNEKGKVDTIILRYYPKGSITEQWIVSVSSSMLQKRLSKREYSNAVRYPFEPFGLPGLAVFGENRGCNELTGSFTIKELKISYNNKTPKLQKLTVFFSQLCEGRKPAFTGTFYFNTVPNRVLPLKAKPLC